MCINVILMSGESAALAGSLFFYTSSRAFSNELSAGIRDYLIEEGAYVYEKKLYV